MAKSTRFVTNSIVRLITFSLAVGLCSAAALPSRQPLPLRDPVKEKNFYLLALLESTPEAAATIRRNPALDSLRASFWARAEKAAECGTEPECVVTPMLFTDSDIERSGQALREVYAASEELRWLVDNALRASGMYVRSHDKSGADLLEAAWNADIRGVNRMAQIYGLGAKPRYPAIDSIAIDLSKDSAKRLLQVTAVALVEECTNEDLFFSPTLRMALALAMASDRDEAGRFEPMQVGENRAAFERVATVDWSRYPYTAILVPGSGSDRPGVAMSPWGRLRVRIAARRYQQGKAPFLIVSGGFVHPNQTPYCEALEMKKALMRDYAIPENAILIEPHARHTTTNIRNANRVLYRYGFPFAAKALITTDPYQSRSIESATFVERCQRELGYLPYAGLKRIGTMDLEYQPTIDSLQSDPIEPLDP